MTPQQWAQFIACLEDLSESQLAEWVQLCTTQLGDIQDRAQLPQHIHLLYPSTFACVWERLSPAQQQALKQLVARLEANFGDLQQYFQARENRA